MPTTMVLEFRDLVTATIEAYRQNILQYGYVWWGWWNKRNERIPRFTFAAFRERIEQEGGLSVYLLDSGNERLYKAHLVEIDESGTETPKLCREPDKTPIYYRTAVYKAWFRFDSIEDAPLDELRQWSYDEVDDFLSDLSSSSFQDKRVHSASEMLGRSDRTIYFMKPYEKQHWDQVLTLTPPDPPKNYITDPIARVSNYILHLSDIHFSQGHHGFATGQQGRRLSSLIADDLRREYGDVPPAAVVMSGDLTWNSRASEFEMVKEFVGDLGSIFGLLPNHFVIIPGNHDIDWGIQEEQEYDRTKPVEKPKEEAYNNYRNFYKEVFGVWPTDYLSMGRRYILGNYIPIDIVGLNSSQLEQKLFAGYGYVSLEQFKEATQAMGWGEEEHGSKYRMLVLHHHIIAVTPEEEITRYDKNYSLTLDAGELIFRSLELEVDLVAHGHMHQPFLSTITRATKSTRVSQSRSLAVHGAGSAGVKREHTGSIGKNAYSVYSFDQEGISISIRAVSENVVGFEEDWRCRFIKTLKDGLKASN